MLIPIYAMNTDKDIWGDDALEFRYVFSLLLPPPRCCVRARAHAGMIRPERWESPPETVYENPGVWSNIMTFLGGPRACIGYQFSLVVFV